MRNLKRALSLTLASVMLLGMMVVGSSAAGYPDVDENDNVEAIEVIQAVGVMVGDENGNFSPDSQVTRAQMAVIMAKLMNLGGYIPGSNPFSDVPEWAQASVSACYTRGIVSGYGNGLYGANDPVTAVQAASMLMRALGYFQYAEDYKDGFETATVRQAGRIDLFNGIGEATAKTELTRNQVAQMVLNTLKSGTVEADDSSKVNVNVDGIQVSVGATNYVYVTSREAYAKAINDAEAGNSTDTTGLHSYIVDLGEKLYQGNLRLDNDDQDDFNRPAYTWEYKTEKIGTYTKAETYSYTKGVSNKDLANRLGNALKNDYTWAVYYNGEDITAEANGAKPVSTSTSTWSKTATGTLTQVFVTPKDRDDDGHVVISMIDTVLAEVVRVNDDSFTVNYLDATSSNYARKSNLVIGSRQTQIDAENTGLSVGDRLLVRLYEDGNGRFSVYDYSVAETVTGTVTAVKARYDLEQNESGTYAVMDGTTYNYVGNTFAEDLADTDQENPTISAENTLYLDYYDNMIAFEATEREVDYLYLKAAHEYLGNYQARVTFSDGTTEVVNINKLYKYSIGADDKAVYTEAKGAAKQPTEKTVYAYRQDGSNYQLYELRNANRISGAAPSDPTEDNLWNSRPGCDTTYGHFDNGTTSDGTTGNPPKAEYFIKNGNNSIRWADAAGKEQNVITLNNNTVFVDVEGGKVYTGYSDVPSMTGISFFAIYNKQLNADVVFITAGADNIDSNSFFYVLDRRPIAEGSAPNSTSRASTSDTIYYTYSVWKDGQKTTVTLKGDNTDKDKNALEKHCLYKINTMNSDGYVTECELVLDVNKGLDGVSKAYDADLYYAETANSGSMRIIEDNATDGVAAKYNGAKNNIDHRYDNCTDDQHGGAGATHRIYKIDADKTVFMEVRIDKNGDYFVRPAGYNAVVASLAKSSTAHTNNVYVMSVDDRSASTPMATLVWLVTYDVKPATAGVTINWNGGTAVKDTDFTVSGPDSDGKYTVTAKDGATVTVVSGTGYTVDNNVVTITATTGTVTVKVNKGASTVGNVKWATDAKKREADFASNGRAFTNSDAELQMFMQVKAADWARPDSGTPAATFSAVVKDSGGNVIGTATDIKFTGVTAYNATTKTPATMTFSDVLAATNGGAAIPVPMGEELTVEITEVKYDKVAYQVMESGKDVTKNWTVPADITVGDAQSITAKDIKFASTDDTAASAPTAKITAGTKAEVVFTMTYDSTSSSWANDAKSADVTGDGPVVITVDTSKLVPSYTVTLSNATGADITDGSLTLEDWGINDTHKASTVTVSMTGGGTLTTKKGVPFNPANITVTLDALATAGYEYTISIPKLDNAKVVVKNGTLTGALSVGAVTLTEDITITKSDIKIECTKQPLMIVEDKCSWTEQTIVIVFNQAVTQATATVHEGTDTPYTLTAQNAGAKIGKAVLSDDGKTVTLTISGNSLSNGGTADKVVVGAKLKLASDPDGAAVTITKGTVTLAADGKVAVS